MKSNLNRSPLGHPEAQVLRQLLKGFAMTTAMRENQRAARPAVAHTARLAPVDPRPVVVQGPICPPLGLQPAIVHRPSRVRLGLRPAVKHPCKPGHPGRLQASRPGQKSSLRPVLRQGTLCCQLSSSHNLSSLHGEERAREANPLISAGLSSSLTPSSVPHVQKAEPRKSEATSDVIKSVNAARSITKQARETVRTGDRKL